MRAAAVQLSSTPDRDRNLEAADRLTRAAAARGAELVVLPEKWPVLGTPEQTAAGAEPLDGAALALGARRPRASWGSTSSPARSPSASRAPSAARTPASTSAPTARTARSTARSTCSTSRSAGAPTASPSTRRRATRSSRPSSPTATGLGLTICYDLRFPELYRILAVRGATVITVPAAFTETTTRDHWEVLLRARAIEDQCFVVAANQVGEPAPGLRTGGRSMIVDPWGVVLAQAPDAETFVVADLDLDRLRGDPRRSCRRSPTAGRPPTAGPTEVRA